MVIFEVRELSSKTFYVGELASLTGVTIRALQYYDNIGLLSPSGSKEGNKRCYNQTDLMKLQQIIFYKSVGFSLKDIKSIIVDIDDPYKLNELLSKQSSIIKRKLVELTKCLGGIEACQKVLSVGKYPDYELLLKYSLNVSSLSDESWAMEYLSEENQEKFNKNNANVYRLDYNNHFKNLLIEAVMLEKAGVKPNSEQGSELAQRWWTMMLSIANDDIDVILDLIQVGVNTEKLPPDEKVLMENAKTFLITSIKYYFDTNNVKYSDEVYNRYLELKNNKNII